MQATNEEMMKALLYIQRRLKAVTPGTGNAIPTITEMIGYIDGFTGYVETDVGASTKDGLRREEPAFRTIDYPKMTTRVGGGNT